MTRRLLNLLTAFALLLCVAVVALWVRSWQVQDVLYFDSVRENPTGFTRDCWEVHCLRGFVFVQHTVAEMRGRYKQFTVPPRRWLRMPVDKFFAGMPDPDGPPPERWGFKLSREQSDQGWVRLSQLVVSFPHWSALLVAGVPPFVRVLRVTNRRRRTGRGLCAHCGYDLRATPGRCPECGTVFSAPPAP